MLLRNFIWNDLTWVQFLFVSWNNKHLKPCSIDLVMTDVLYKAHISSISTKCYSTVSNQIKPKGTAEVTAHKNNWVTLKWSEKHRQNRFLFVSNSLFYTNDINPDLEFSENVYQLGSFQNFSAENFNFQSLIEPTAW